MSKLGFDGARKRAQEQMDARLIGRARQGQAFLVETHETAPRGGRNLNSFDQPRSAPGEAPAIEFGNLLQKLNQEVTLRDGKVTLFVNHAPLENYNADARIAPRPLGVPMIEFLLSTPLPVRR